MTEETATGAPTGDPGPDNGIPQQRVPPKEKWANKSEFIFTMAGAIIGLGTTWRFPYLCYIHGGVAFFIPYCLMLLFCGLPVLLLETALGQYTSEGGVTAWRKISPMFEGVGVASQVLVSYVNIYFTVLMAWVMFYLYNCLKSPLPWTTCDNQWNTESCHSAVGFANPDLFRPDSNWSFLNNVTTTDFDDYDNFMYMNSSDYSESSEMEFWIHRVHRMSDDMSIVNIHWDIAFCLMLSWVVCYFCIWKGIKITGKVVYFTVTLPYLLLLLIFIRGVTLPGAMAGLSYYLYPDFSMILDPSMWYDAAIQVLYSLCLCYSVTTALGSYNKYNNNCYTDCLTLCALSTVTGILAGFAVFPLLGFASFRMGVSVESIAASGMHLIFITIPQALSLLPGAAFWHVVFFLLIFFLCLDSQFVFMESLATAISDAFPRRLRRPGARELLVLAIAGVCFLLELPLITDGGMLLFNIIDIWGVSEVSIFIIVSLETIVIAWVYGADRFYDNIEDMIGYQPFSLMKYCWLFITPLICGFMMLFKLSRRSFFIMRNYSAGIMVSLLGSLMMVTPLLCIPLFILISLCRNGENMTTPSSDLRQARPHKPLLTMCGCVVLKAQTQPNRSVDDRSEKILMGEPSRD